MRPLLPLVVAMLLPALFSAGCAGLDTTAKAEGTGIQIVGAIVVLAKYRASQNQIQIAETRARRAFVELAMKPAYESRVRKLKKIAATPGKAKPAAPGKPAAPDPAAIARAELASLTASWNRATREVTRGAYAGDFATPSFTNSATTVVNFPKMSDSQVLAASASYVPRFIAVSVPAEQSVAGSKASVMLWDTRTNRIASDTVYALDRTPPVNKPSEIDRQKVLFTSIP